jgi:hypothetical protein
MHCSNVLEDTVLQKTHDFYDNMENADQELFERIQSQESLPV